MKKSRMRVNVGDEELHITIPARRHPLTILIFVVWSVVIVQFLHDALGGIVTGRMLITAIVCMLPGVAGLCWILLGREEIRITEGNLVRRVHVGPIGFTRAYALADARNFRLAQLPPCPPIGSKVIAVSPIGITNPPDGNRPKALRTVGANLPFNQQ